MDDRSGRAGRSARPSPPRRRIRRSASLLAAAVAALFLALWAGRQALVTAWIAARLAERGLAPARFEVVEVSLARVRLERLDLAGGALAAAAATAHFRLAELGAGRLERLVLDRPELRLDLAAPGPVAFPGGALAGIGRIEVRAGRVVMATSAGPVTATIRGSSEPEAGGRLRLRLAGDIAATGGRIQGRFAGVLAGGRLDGAITIERGELAAGAIAAGGIAGTGELAWSGGWPERLSLQLTAEAAAGRDRRPLPLVFELDFDHGRLQAVAESTSPDPSLAARVTVRSDGRGGPAAVAIAASAGITWPGLAALPAGWPDLRRGRVCVELDATADLAPGAITGGDLASRGRQLVESLSGRLEARYQDLEVAGLGTGISGSLVLAGGVVAPSPRLYLQPQGSFRIGRLDPALADRLGLPAATAVAADLEAAALVLPRERADFVLADGRLRARVEGGSGTHLSLSGGVTGSSGIVAGAGRLAAVLPVIARAGLRADRVEVDLPLAGESGARGLVLGLAAPGAVAVGSLAVPGRVRLLAPIRLAVESGALAIRRGRRGRLALVAAAQFAADDVALALAVATGGVGEAIPATLGSLRIGLDHRAGRTIARLAADRSRLSLPGHALAFEEVSADLEAVSAGGTIGGHGSLTIGRLRHLASVPWLAPLQVAATLDLAAGALAVDGEVRFLGVARAASWRLAGHWQPAAARGALQLRGGDLEFDPGGLQPLRLAPALGSLQGVRGRARLDAEAVLADGRGQVAARLRLDQWSFAAGAVRVTGLSTDLALDSLFPLAARAGQTLRVQRIEAGAGPPLEDVALRFALAGAGNTRLELEAASAGFLGGRLEAGATAIDLDRGVEALDLSITGLDLGRLLAAVGLDGLSGEGRLDGVLPLRHIDGELLVPHGRLTAQGPGVIRYRSPQARKVLADAGQAVDLAVTALEDFRYQELSATFSQEAGSATHLMLRVLGANPEVLDGYPFQVNLDLSGNSKSLLAALGESYRLRQGFWKRVRE